MNYEVRQTSECGVYYKKFLTLGEAKNYIREANGKTKPWVVFEILFKGKTIFYANRKSFKVEFVVAK